MHICQHSDSDVWATLPSSLQRFSGRRLLVAEHFGTLYSNQTRHRRLAVSKICGTFDSAPPLHDL